MCGISLAIGKGSQRYANIMSNAILTRGIKTYTAITDGGLFGGQEFTVRFEHLPITAQQPFIQFASEGQLLFLNGFISNHKELKKKYGLQCATNCDTEVIARLLDRFGEDAFKMLNGFFAVAWYNGKQWIFKTDRYGIKQLYYYDTGDSMLVCSEPKGILKALENAGVKIELDELAVKDWLHSLGVMTEHTIYEGVKRIPKLKFDKPNKLTTSQITYEQAKIELKRLWLQSIDRNKTSLESGCFLSGGIDSGIIAKFIEPEYSFSVDYLDRNYSEINNIKLNSRGQHFTLIANDRLFNKYLKRTADCIDDLKVGSCYTNYAIGELASKYCRVMYSGAGGDELFGGYRHRNIIPIENVIQRTSYGNNSSFDITHQEYDFKFLEGVLIVEDRIGGAHTFETRYPLLDNDFANFALSLPEEHVKNKRILKDISELSEEVIHGQKKGFSNPHLTSEEWAEFMLKTKENGFIQ